jgi:hypothetical protein
MCLSLVDGQLVLDMIKVRGGMVQSVIIDPAEFDTSQGVEWPVPSVLSC